MTTDQIFPPLTDWEPTRDTMHRYAQAVGVIPRALAPAHPQWWHISLKVSAAGLVTDKMALPGGGQFWLTFAPGRHAIELATGDGLVRRWDMAAGLTATELGDQLIAAVAGLGLTADYARDKFADDAPRQCDPAAAERFWTAVTLADEVFKAHRATLDGDKGPVQLWPHGFDLAFEWFGSRRVEYEEDGATTSAPAQLNLGFSPGEPNHPAPYFYSNPWPFAADELLGQPLPDGAGWFTDGWQGTILPYAALAGDPQGAARLRQYARAVYELARPTLVE